MFEVVMLNEKGERFSKFFDSYYLFQKFLNKVKRSKKITLVRSKQMLFLVISIVFLFLFIIAFFGDYEEKTNKKDYKYMKKICNKKEGKK